MATYKKKHIKIFQNGTVVFDKDCYVCVDGENTYSKAYFYRRDHNSRRLKVFEKPDGSHKSYITLGVADTAIIKDK